MALFIQEKQSVPSNLLREKFGWPPFSVLDTKLSEWQRRVDEWEIFGVHEKDGRDVKRYNAVPTNIFSARGKEAKKAESISRFDPFLCELMYRWFSNPEMKILDPFAGGSVRGIVASVLGRNYVGIDLSEKQIEANKVQYEAVSEKYSDLKGSAEWLCGDSEEILSYLPLNFDMVLTCPPYYNLEVYTKNSADLSRQKTYKEFLEKYRSILIKSAKKLKDGSFFCIVVSNIRKTSQILAGSYILPLVSDTINILNEELYFYNDMVLLNNLGSLPIRAPQSFNHTRKVGKCHQNILLFYKGDIEAIPNKYCNQK